MLTVDLSLSFLPDDDSPKKLYISDEVGNPDKPEGGGNVLRSVKILTYTFTLKAIHINFHVAVKYHNVLNLEMVVI
jgi:hypothetical protein